MGHIYFFSPDRKAPPPHIFAPSSLKSPLPRNFHPVSQDARACLASVEILRLLLPYLAPSDMVGGGRLGGAWEGRGGDGNGLQNIITTAAGP